MYSMSSQVKESDCRKCSADTRMTADTLGGDGTRHQGRPLAPAIRAGRLHPPSGLAACTRHQGLPLPLLRRALRSVSATTRVGCAPLSVSVCNQKPLWLVLAKSSAITSTALA